MRTTLRVLLSHLIDTKCTGTCCYGDITGSHDGWQEEYAISPLCVGEDLMSCPLFSEVIEFGGNTVYAFHSYFLTVKTA